MASEASCREKKLRAKRARQTDSASKARPPKRKIASETSSANDFASEVRHPKRKIASEASSANDFASEASHPKRKKNSRTKRLQEISKEYEESYLALRGIFKIRFLTSEESALKAKLTDHEQFLKLTLELSKDTNVKKGRRDELLDLHKRLKNSENFFKTLSVMSALNEVISPYQK